MTAPRVPRNISSAIPRGVPSVSNPTSSPLVAPRANWATPINAAAEPECAACLARAPAVTLPLVKPWQLNVTNTGATIIHRECTPLQLNTSNTVAAVSDTRAMTRSMTDSPNRGSSRALICDPAINPQEHRPKMIPNCHGVSPNPWMNTGDDPPRYANMQNVVAMPINAWARNTGSRMIVP